MRFLDLRQQFVSMFRRGRDARFFFNGVDHIQIERLRQITPGLMVRHHFFSAQQSGLTQPSAEPTVGLFGLEKIRKIKIVKKYSTVTSTTLTEMLDLVSRSIGVDRSQKYANKIKNILTKKFKKGSKYTLRFEHLFIICQKPKLRRN